MLTNKYGENTDQIEKLAEIANKQNDQIKALQLLLTESQIQTKEGLTQSDLLSKSNDKLVQQSSLLSGQVRILTSEQTQSNHFRQLSRQAAYMKLKNTASFIGDLTTIEGLRLDNPNPDSRRRSIVQLEELLSSELSNQFLLEHKEVAKEWANVYSTARITHQLEFTPDESWKKDINAKPNEDQSIQAAKIKMFNRMVSMSFKLYMNVLTSLVWNQESSGYF